MSVVAYLIAYSIVLLVVAPRLLRLLTAGGLAPHLGVAAWLIATASVLLCWVAVVLLLFAGLVQVCIRHSGLMVVCMDRLHDAAAGADGAVPQIVVLATIIGVSAASLTVGARLARSARRLRVRARDHAEAIRLVGSRTGPDDVVVVPADKPAAYCVSGNPPTIVVTSAALAALNDSELAAVLAHERAHLRGRHWMIVIGLRSLTTAMPRIPLIRQAAQHVPRLLEMCADDAATRWHDRRDLLSGLITLCGATPSKAMAAAEIAVLERAERLSRPPTTRAQRLESAALGATIAILSAGPWITAISACIVALSCDT